MPIYVFKCIKCGKTLDIVRPMRNSDEPCICQGCGTSMVRDYQNGKPHVTPKLYRRSIVSDALGIHPSQTVEHQQVYPDIPVTPTGQLVFESYKQHDTYLKEQGFQFKPRKRKLKGKITKISEMSTPR